MEIAEMALDLSKTLEARRKSLGLNQAEVAALAEVSPRFMYDLERGKPTVSLDKLLAVATVLGLNLTLRIASNE